MHHYLELVWYKACADLRAEAARAYLGTLWWVLEPLLYMAVFYLVFGVLLQRGGEGFIAFLLCGLTVWRWFGSSVIRCANAIPSNARLMLQVYLPKYLFPAIALVTSTLRFLIVFTLFLIYLVFAEHSLSASWLALPALLVIHFLLIAACASLLAAIVPFLPDLRIFVENGLTLMFFMSGIFYDISSFPADLRVYFYLNPMATIIESYRAVLLEGAWPEWQALTPVLLVAMLGIGAALYLLTRYDRRYAKLAIS
jgi:lipopolysaccharide transport system permease protein